MKAAFDIKPQAGLKVNVLCSLTALLIVHLNSALRLIYLSSKYLLNVYRQLGPPCALRTAGPGRGPPCWVSEPAGRQAVPACVMGDRTRGALAQSSVSRQDSARHAGTQGNWERPPGWAG